MFPNSTWNFFSQDDIAIFKGFMEDNVDGPINWGLELDYRNVFDTTTRF